MSKRSAGLLIYRHMPHGVEVLLVHPGGPFWASKDDGAWSIPKGLVEDGEDDFAAARRETKEEIGADITGTFIPLGEVRQSGAKIIVAWAVEADLDAANIASNTFSMEWPPRSGRLQSFPEIDRAEWFAMAKARTKILKRQAPLIDVLKASLG